MTDTITTPEISEQALPKQKRNASHTSGPWEVTRVPIESRGGSNTCFKVGPFVACIYDDWRPREVGISEVENVANAYLIAASPRLLEALIRCADLLADYDEADGEEGEAYREAIAAIAEAKGLAA